jgi:uncharacterized protein YdeI (YjbR/CyaY-like superfamily)
MANLTPRGVIYFDSPAALSDWFEANHASIDELWVGYHRVATGVPSVTWSQAVDEALCVGWIDGIRKGVDDRRFVQRFTPRRPGSTWSAVNVAKVATLTAEGRMRPAGLAAFEARTAANTAMYGYEQGEVAFSADEITRFNALEGAWAGWLRRPPSYRKAATHWVVSAKRSETRERRLVALIEASAAGTDIQPMRRPTGR